MSGEEPLPVGNTNRCIGEKTKPKRPLLTQTQKGGPEKKKQKQKRLLVVPSQSCPYSPPV